ncbi:MAG: hypothetical protein AB7L36_14015 [Sphingomonadaceae bacterium]
MPLRLILILALAMSSIATRSAATELHTAVPVPHAAQALFVELIVNGVSSETIVPLQIADDRMMIEGDLLKRSGLAFVSEGLVNLASLQGVRSSYDIATQTLNLDVEPELLPTRRVSSARNTRLPTVADYGAMLNYDAYAQRVRAARRLPPCGASSVCSARPAPFPTAVRSGSPRVAVLKPKPICALILHFAMSTKIVRS